MTKERKEDTPVKRILKAVAKAVCVMLIVGLLTCGLVILATMRPVICLCVACFIMFGIYVWGFYN